MSESSQQDGRDTLASKSTVSAASLTSAELFRHGNTVRIEHAGETYWLRLTRGNKLILTK